VNDFYHALAEGGVILAREAAEIIEGAAFSQKR
jgi:hypothetical protein